MTDTVQDAAFPAIAPTQFTQDAPGAGAAHDLAGVAERYVRHTVQTLEDTSARVSKQLSAAAEAARERVQATYGEAKDRLSSAKAKVDPFVQEQPYAALGVAVTVGLLAGLLLASRGPKVIYIRPPRT